MKISVFKLPEKGLDVEYAEMPAVFPMLEGPAQGDWWRITSPIAVQGNLKREHAMIRLRASLGFSATIVCRRCLTEFDRQLHRRFELFFTDNLAELAGTDTAEGTTFTADQAGVIRFEGHEIDLADPIAEQVLLTIPDYPLCRAECRGLCARCGADLNQEACRCGEPPVDPRLAVLRHLKID